ncbi:hypothetical protein LOZ33_000648 [Ophidiomyces ophidiicola]|nr:hypothetical protein LOZ56_001494 [Ophidiomyces ophidiicola]KAI2037890.1 hypothetical protein LOZ48_000251 [Ophidiomyces ophidiicola]KAI2104060.1 hypothetical protein LOZ33_000648 [Ophidiomyces ophidiicola]KAI2129442.1 hypothetical protein LOZ31_001462 [Ophidiomyces ophidiicola]KAI2144900.1 hypothetical protein LOZ29_000581 [Ophidiomyces ophidiicola]
MLFTPISEEDVEIKEFLGSGDDAEFSWERYAKLHMWEQGNWAPCPECQRRWACRKEELQESMGLLNESAKVKETGYRARKPKGLEVVIYDAENYLHRRSKAVRGSVEEDKGTKGSLEAAEFGWFVGHLCLVLAVFRYLLSVLTFNSGSGMAQASYRFAFIAAAATYGIVVYKAHVTRGDLKGSVPAIVMKLGADENVQYLLIALVWLYARQITIAVFPFAIYSFFHVATFTRSHVIPTIQPPKEADAAASSSSAPPTPKPSPLSEAIGRFIKQYYDASMGLVASLELALLLRLVGTALTFSSGSWILLVVYFFFFRARYAGSRYVRGTVAQLNERIEVSISHQNTPPVVRQGWQVLKDSIQRGYELTDVRRYVGGEPAAGGKKPHVAMSLVSRVTSLFGTTATDSSTQTNPPSAPASSGGNGSPGYSGSTSTINLQGQYDGGEFQDSGRAKRLKTMETWSEQEQDEREYRPPYLHSMLAGGIGGTSGDMLMHSLDTVKTRQQGDPHIPPKYTSMSSSYAKIFRQEGIRRGLYGGVTPALLGSFPGTVIFFGTYEYSKRHMLDAGINPSLSYFAGGLIADLAACFVYVPSEVLKTRLQLQGRYNNPFFQSGYNYRSTLDAFRTIIKQEGFFALYSGFKATLLRDLPFSALQFAFYEQEQRLAKEWVGSRDIGLPLEILTATSAGGMAGVMTCPLDVVKTRIQTQHSDPQPSKTSIGDIKAAFQESSKHVHSSSPSTSHSQNQSRLISTSSPSTSTVKPGALILDTSSVFTGLKLIYKTEGILGWFRGVGPRFLWTSVQSGTMLVLYQFLLKQMEASWSAQELSSASSL